MSFEDDNSDPKEFNESSLKYGDSDLSSKRRKSEYDLSENDFNDYINFETAALDCGLNSTLVEKHCNAFKVKVKNKDNGSGLLKGTLSSILAGDSFFSKQPSDTSRGFKNTFSILENQIATSRKRRKILQPISEEYEPELGVGETNNCCKSIEDETTKPDMFELELEARERIKAILSQPTKSSDSITLKPPTQITSPINEMLYGITPIGIENKQLIATAAVGEEMVHEQFCDHPECVYHISKGKDGKKYLRVVRHLLLDKVLCGNRVSQMTRAYDDIEAVTRLLEEKEKDLELTVQIGKELLTQNNRLENRIAELEVELKSSNEDRSQLVHDLHKKTELISILTNDVDDSSDNETPTYSKSITLELMQKKIATLQDENKSLKVEVTQISKQTDEVEEQERKLMEDITMQLNSTNSQFDNISLELERQREENRLQHEQIISLTARLAEAEMRLHQLTQENDEQSSLLGITKENQNLLAIELTEFKTRYQEVLGLLQEAQDQLRKQRKKIQPNGRSSYIPGLGGYGPVESLQTELMESSMYSENSLDSGISTDRMSASGGMMSNVPDIGGVIPPYKKVFETVRCAGKNGHYSDGMSHLGAMSLSSTSGPRMSAMPYMATGLSSNPAGSYHHRTSSMYSGSSYTSYESSMGIKTMSCESLASQSDDGYPSQPSGVPGVPGAKDLEAALKRLTPAEVLARRAMLSYAPAGTYTYDDNPPILPLGIRTPDSIMSTGSSGGTSSTNQWRLPEKLQIVKPMEGSQTLHHWSRLATPTLSGLLEERPGVTIRGGRGLDELGMQVYSLSDVEEDVEDLPGKQFQESGYVYTYTNSCVMHPDDGMMNDLSFLSQSQLSSRMASASTSRQPSCPATPIGRSRKNSCSTYSVNMGLASMLNERGIKAITPSALNTPAGPNFTPTVTPCNSPEGTPSRSNSPEPMFGIFSTGADMIRRKLIGEVERPTRSHSKHQKIMLSRLEKRALRSLRLVEKVESLGLENIISTQSDAMNQLAHGIANRSSSPMAQIGNFKVINKNPEDLHFNREQIKEVLTKGLSTPQTTPTTTSIYTTSLEQQQKQLQPAEIVPASSNSSTHNKPAAPPNVHLQRQRSRRNIKNGMSGQRPDLGTVGGRVRPDLGKVGHINSRADLLQNQHEEKHRDDTIPQQTMTQSFVGSISSLLFGRKGGWL